MANPMNYKEQNIINSWSRMIECIIHDVTTPLVTARMTAELIGNVMPKLLQGYQLAVEQQLLEPSVDKHYLKYFEEKNRGEDITKNVTEVLEFLSLMHSLKQLVLPNTQHDVQSVDESLKHAIQTYPFLEESQRNLVRTQTIQPFSFACDRLFLDSLFSNLITNALTSIKLKGHGELDIWSEQSNNQVILHFKDTGKGIDANNTSKVFKRFFSERSGQVVPGLGFCRLALLQQDVDITFSSVPNEYTEFLIKFPQ